MWLCVVPGRSRVGGRYARVRSSAAAAKTAVVSPHRRTGVGRLHCMVTILSVLGCLVVFDIWLYSGLHVLFPGRSCVQWNFACTPPYRTPSTFSSNTSPALSIRMSSVKSRLSNSTPFVVVKRVNRLLGTELRSVVSVQTLMRPLRNESGATSESQAIRSSSTMSDWPGRKLRV